MFNYTDRKKREDRNSIVNEKGDITTGSSDFKRILREYYEKTIWQ